MSAGEQGPRRGDDDADKHEVWSDLFKWARNSATYAAKPHDRPAPVVEGPAVAWGIALRPSEAGDPLLAVNPQEEARRKAKWIDQINNIVRLFLHPDITAPNEDQLPWLELSGGASGAEKKNDERPQISIESRHFPFIWRGLLGVLSVETHTEFVKFLFVFSAAPWLSPAHPRYKDLKLENDYSDLIDVNEIKDSDERGKLTAMLNVIGAKDGDATPEQVEEAADYLYDEFWLEFARKLRRMALDENFDGGRDIRTRVSRQGESLFPGEVLGSLRIVVASSRTGWEGWDPADAVRFGWRKKGDPLDDHVDNAPDLSPDRVDPSVEAYHFMHVRRRAFDAIFGRTVDREFVANRVLSGRHIFISPLGSTIQTEMNAAARERKDEGASLPEGVTPMTPPSRALLLLRSRAEPHQIGRFIERLHALQTLRIMALTNYAELIQVGSRLRSLGLRFDKKVSAAPDEHVDIRSHELRKIFDELQELGKEVRGGLSYRVSRANLYATSFERRIEEMRCSDPDTGRIDGWQPYDEFIRRRLKESFTYLSDLSDRRDRLFRRIGLLLERLQWQELTNVQKDAHNTLRSTDEIAYIGVIAASATLGLGIGGPLAEQLPELRAWVAPEISAPITPSEANDLTQEQADRANNAVFGAFVGFWVGVAITAALYLFRGVRNWIQDQQTTDWWRRIFFMSMSGAAAGGLGGALKGEALIPLLQASAPDTVTGLRDWLAIQEITAAPLPATIICGLAGAVLLGAGYVIVHLLRFGVRSWRRRRAAMR